MKSTPRLKAGIFVRALIRRVQVAAASAYVIRSGAEEAGSIILKISKLDGSVLVLDGAMRGSGLAVPSPQRGAPPRRSADNKSTATEKC